MTEGPPAGPALGLPALELPALELPALELPAEPVRLRGALRLLIGEDPAAARSEIVRRLADRLWQRWRTDLAPFGVRRATFRSAVSDHGREAWLWVMGDRTWEQMAEGLAGRVLRRAIATSPGRGAH